MAMLRPDDLPKSLPEDPHLHLEMRHNGAATLDVVLGWLKRVTYKPDTAFEPYYVGWQDQIVLHVFRRLPDSTKGTATLEMYANTWEFIRVSASSYIPMVYVERGDFDGFVRWLREELLKLEQHELDEWLRVDGELPFDPHVDAKRQA